MIIEILNYQDYETAKTILEQRGLTFDVYDNATACYIAQEIDFHLEMYAANEGVELSAEICEMVHSAIRLDDALEYETMQELVNQTVEKILENAEESDEEAKQERIADLVEQGYTSGYDPVWSITIEEDENDDEIRLTEIAQLIREGYTSGYGPTWTLSV